MGCWGSEGHREDKSRILGISLYLVAVNDALIRFLDEGVEDDQCRIRIRSAADFISIVGADYSDRLRKRLGKLSFKRKLYYGFRQDDQSQIRYVHFDVFRRFIEERKYQDSVLNVVKKLRSLLDCRLKIKTKKKNARLCLYFLGKFQDTCLYQHHHYVPRVPKGIREILTQNAPADQSR